MTPVEMPKANENLTEATLDRWLVQPGQTVAPDQSLCEIITDKAKFELPSPAAGLVLEVLAAERSVLPVGYVLCVLGQAGEKVSPEIGARNKELLAAHHSSTVALGSTEPQAQAASAPSLGGGVRATPVARRIARENSLDLAQIAQELGLQAPVSEKDVREYLQRRGKKG